MPEIVLFPDATAALTSFLRAELPDYISGVTVGSAVPNPRPDTFVTVRRVGGVAVNRVVDGAFLAVECWGSHDAEAHDLAQICRGLIHSLSGTTYDTFTFYRVLEVGGPVNLPDPDSDQSRYTATYQVDLRGYAA